MSANNTGNPQAAMVADESMLRTLRFQTEAIWPQESLLFARYGLAAHSRILDVGCGSGEATSRLAAMYPTASLIGVDVGSEVLAAARERHAALAPRLSFESGDGFALRFDSASFDLVVCRHVTQLVPQPEKLLAELTRVLAPGGWLHVLSEDYMMLHFPERNGIDPDRLWRDGPVTFCRATGTDARIGRRTLPILRGLGLRDVRADYLTIDTERVPRATLAGIFTAWRDGYADALASVGGRMTPAEARELFDCLLATLADPDSYAVWHVPIVCGRLAG
jgi:SAM-dependent methyltransferase